MVSIGKMKTADSTGEEPMNCTGKACGLVLFVFALLSPIGLMASQPLPDGFVYLEDVIPSILLEMRYFSDHNFTGKAVDGYLNPRCIITRQAAVALKHVQDELLPFGLGIKVFDAYRPQRAVDNFVRWAADLNDTKTKAQYYPDVAKPVLFKEGYLAAKSTHSRGSTVDLTIIELSSGAELDMGSSFDFFGPVSWPESTIVPPHKLAYRLLLRTLMIEFGFNPYAQEWWHFTLAGEPYPDTYYDFPVE
jgi:D-alanyl-D-alanine dipeptidase